MSPLDTTVLSAGTPSEDASVEEIVNELDYDASNALLKDLEAVMQLPEMEAFRTYLAVRVGGVGEA